MTPSDSDESLIVRLLGMPEGERTAYLERACAEDSSLRDRLKEIQQTVRELEADAARLSTAENPRGKDLSALRFALDARTGETAGTWIGRYKLLQEIGEGGFGVVWMAEQHEPIRRRVALKIIKSGMDTREVIARFEAERQALAMMDHPNIAHVFDAGATDAGRPYFVMELVRGVPITRYCDENRLTSDARLRLFITVCQAVQHAHNKGVIHRDLKPSNILITLHDGTPVPKIIDFGIAKATTAPLTDKTLFTRFHSFIGTPAYTSPEQMEMSGLDVDTRSDIYSLGVLLYELVAGRPPFDPDALAKSGLDAMRRTIREVDPPRPSARLGTLPDAARTTVASQRSTDSGKLSLLLRGDLDWIVMRCLEKDRTRRYETANGLSVDVSRFLASEPVAARPPSRVYRLQKFVRRHKLGVAAMSAIAISLIAGLVASSVLLLRERAAHARAVVSERAETELRRQAEEARAAESTRAAATALEVANRHLDDGNVAEGLAYLVHAARFDPHHPAIAPRLASVLASSPFLLPEGDPLQMGAGSLLLHFGPDEDRLEILSESGSYAAVDLKTGQTRRVSLPTAVSLLTSLGGGWRQVGILGRDGEVSRQVGILGRDGVVRVVDRETFQVMREIHFEQRPLRVLNLDEPPARLLVSFEDRSMSLVDLDTGAVRPLALRANPGDFASLVFGGSGWRWAVARVPPDRLEIWDLEAGERRHTGTLAGRLQDATVSRDGTRLATLSVPDADPQNLELQVWSLPELRPLTPAVLVVAAVGAPGNSLVKFSPNDALLLVWGPVGRQIYDATTGTTVGPTFSSPPSVGLAIASFLPDGKNLLARVEGGIQIIEIATGKGMTPVMSHPGPVRQLVFSQGGEVLLTTCSDGFARVWNARTGRLLAQPVVQDPAGLSAALSPDGTQLFLGTSGGAVYRFRVEQRAAQPIVLPRSNGAPMPALFLMRAPARLLWLGVERARVIDVATGRDTAGGFNYPEPIRSINGTRGPAVRPDLGCMVVCTLRNGWQAWHLGTRGVERVVRLENSPAGGAWAALSPDQATLALIATADATTIRFWNLDTGREIGRPLESGAGFYVSNARVGGFSPDGRRFVAGANDGTVSVCDVATGELMLQPGPLRENRFKFVGYSPDGARIGTAQAILGDVQLWDAGNGQAIGPVHRFAVRNNDAEFSHDGSRFLACPDARPVSVWRSHDGTLVTELPLREGARSARFSPDDRRIVTTSNDTTARIWDTTSGLALTEPMRHIGRVVTGTFSPDGRFLCTEVAQSETEPSMFYLWSAPPSVADTPVPEWLLQLATIHAGKRVDDRGRCVDATESLATLDLLRVQLAAWPADDPLASWGRWLLDTGPERSIAPGFALTSGEAEALAADLAAATVTNEP